MIAEAVAPPARRLSIVILGLSITSSWGNGHATTYRSLVRALCQRGHEVLFLERDAPWYAAHRDLEIPPFDAVRLYRSLDQLAGRWRPALARADLVILGSYVPDGVAVASRLRRLAGGLFAFYDIDTPVTLAGLAADDCPYLTPDLIRAFDLYLSFTGGPALRLLEERYGARAARPLYCSVDPESHRPLRATQVWDLGYLGTYSADRQPALEALLCRPARDWPAGRFVVAGPLYPPGLEWPANLERIEHVGPGKHRRFYARQRFTLNITRADMIRMGHSPSVRLFEAAACGTPIISDWWPGLDAFFTPDEHILVARSGEDVRRWLRDFPEAERRRLAVRARRHVLRHHTATHRAMALESYVEDLLERAAPRRLASAG